MCIELYLVASVWDIIVLQTDHVINAHIRQSALVYRVKHSNFTAQMGIDRTRVKRMALVVATHKLPRLV